MEFDASEFDDNEGSWAGDPMPADTVAALARAHVQGDIQKPNVKPTSEDSYLSDVDKRLDVAECYRELLRIPLFNEATEATRVVETEHQRWVRARLKDLLNVGQPLSDVTEAAKQFTDDEVAALRLLLNSMRKRNLVPVSGGRAAPSRRAPETRSRRPAPVTADTPKADEPRVPAQDRARQPLLIERTVIDPKTDKEVKITVPRVQRPSGALPFPSVSGMEHVLLTLGSSAVAGRIEQGL